LARKEDDEIEIMEKTATLEKQGWCSARIKGEKEIRLVPLAYLKIERKVSTTTHALAITASLLAPSITNTSEYPNYKRTSNS